MKSSGRNERNPHFNRVRIGPAVTPLASQREPPSPEACNRDVRRSRGRLERKSLCDGGVTPSCVSYIFELRVSGSRNLPVANP